MSYWETDEKTEYSDQYPNLAGWYHEPIIYKVNSSWKIGLLDDPNGTWAGNIPLSTEGEHTITYYIKKV